MPKVLVFCTILSVLNNLGVMQFIIKNIGGFLALCLNTSPAESIAAAANIFLGTAEVAVIVKDYLPDMSLSELFCVFVTGLSSVAGIAMVVFIGYGIPAGYLLAANVMSAPAALAVAKLSMPDEDKEENFKPEKIDLKKLRLYIIFGPIQPVLAYYFFLKRFCLAYSLLYGDVQKSFKTFFFHFCLTCKARGRLVAGYEINESPH